ncbi:hypothetical protein [Segatella copri]|uniref:hypothetical protein n=1 Tax=Segatella copri TaxID=165179 RepID=UPI001C45E845|nr:hypothetical protein [Segatella copri]MBW0023297.1 hypothetical protein [Segatella copri]
MKKSYFFSALAAGMVMFSACSSDNDLANGGNGSNDAVQQIVLQVANAGDGMQTRAGRPLLSSEAKQTIENVKVIICDGNKIVKEKTYTHWNEDTDSKVYGKDGGAHGREATLTYTGDDKLPNGTYTIYAFGYSNNSDYKDLTTQISDLTEGKPFSGNTILNLKDGVKGEEIFAGSTAQFEINENQKGFTQTVVLNRQVAGTFGYFDKIPYVAGAAKLQLVASNGNTGLVLGGFNSFDLTGNGTGNEGHVNYVVNGTTAAEDNVIYTINLKDWFTNVNDVDHDGLIDDTNWAKPAGYTKATFAKGSVFGGSFLIPFQKNDNQTFVLQLTNDAGDVLKSWAVKLPSTDGQLSEYTLSSWNSTTSVFDNTPATKDVADKYSVVRNHLYGIGERSLDEPTTPGTDPDKPEPLNKKQELTLRVNDNWEVIHKMELE